MRLVVLVLCAAGTVALGADRAWSQEIRFVPPVDGPIAVHFDPPAGTYGPGHRGIDYRTEPGRRVRAAGSGVVAFAGRVAGTTAVTIAHSAGLETTYSDLAEATVVVGEHVEAGDWIGSAGRAHAGSPGLHFGVKVGDAYVDPVTFLGPTDLAGAIHLAPPLWEPGPGIPAVMGAALAPRGPGDGRPECIEPDLSAVPVRPPNDNIAVAVAGITSKTAGRDSADMYEPGPRFFGYPAGRIYRFSYRGARGPDLHVDYEPSDTYGDIRIAARRLGDLLRGVARRHPGADVDLIAHSQGGIVARTYLRESAAAPDPSAARAANLVTIASPHTGAPAALNVDRLRASTIAGPQLLAAASAAARSGRQIPDPDGAAVAQLTPGSDLLNDLAAGDVPYGTRVLSLGIPNDMIVPADRTDAGGDLHRQVPPRDVFDRFGVGVVPGSGHKAIVTSPATRRYVYDFLRGAPEPCPTAWDGWGRRIGRAVSFAEARVGAVVSTLEGPAGRLVTDLRRLRSVGH